MDHQWRPVPPPHSQPNICPVCTASHYPYCNPYPHAPPPPPPPYHHPPYNENPIFPPQRYYPWPDPYHGGAPAPYMANPPGLWERNPNPDYREGFLPPMQHSDYGSGNNYVNGGSGYVGELDRSNKRPRVDPIGSIEFKGEINPNSAMFSFDDERRLKLIRDHGVVSGQEKNSDFDSNGSRIAGPPNGDSVARYSPLQPDVHHDPGNRNGDGNLGHNRYPNSNVITGHSNTNWQNQLPQSYNGMTDHRGKGVGSGYGAPNLNEQRGYPPHHERFAPPLPASPPPPLPNEMYKGSSPPATLFPIPISSPATSIYGHNKPLPRASTAYSSERHGDHQAFLRKELSPPRPMIVDASHLFKQPYRANRPDYIVIILRGLPGSGKSYSAKMMRDMEVEGGGDAPRIHSMDDYFMTEVEKKVEESDGSKSSSSAKHKKHTVKTVVEYCYEPEMEEVYRESMLKAFKKTLEEGSFRLVIVDDRNLRVADFAQFWAIAKRSGYEVYISEAAYTDPAGCAARNVHGFTLDDVQKMAGQWEEAPPMYMKLDVKSLFHGDDLKENGIQEFDMDTEDGEENTSSRLQERLPEMTVVPSVEEDIGHVSSKDGKPWDGEEDQMVGVKELGKSKWSVDFDEDDRKGHGDGKGRKVNALSGLIRAYGKKGKSVHWNDQMANTGFSIGAVKKANMHSLVIGPGAGYNSKSNRLPEEESSTMTGQSSSKKTRRQSSGFQERLRAEQESFKAIFDRRKQRIGVLDLDEE